jgi:hypothetical protein
MQGWWRSQQLPEFEGRNGYKARSGPPRPFETVWNAFAPECDTCPRLPALTNDLVAGFVLLRYRKSAEHAVPRRITEGSYLKALRPSSPTEQDGAHSVLDVRHNDQGIKAQMRSRSLCINLRNPEVGITSDARKFSAQHMKSADVLPE